MRLDELFQPEKAYYLSWQIHGGSISQISYIHARTKDDHELAIGFYPIGTASDRTVNIEFDRNGKTKVTKQGDAIAIFGTVLLSVEMYLKEVGHPKFLIFSASEESRKSLYGKLIDRFASKFGYRRVNPAECNDFPKFHIFPEFVLRRVTKPVGEGVGRITKTNKTKDVGYDQTSIEAKKFGNSVTKDGYPPLLRIKEMKINEVERVSSVSKGIYWPDAQDLEDEDFKKIFSFKSHLRDTVDVYYSVRDHKFAGSINGQSCIEVCGHMRTFKGKLASFEISSLDSMKRNRVWASEFYKNLIMKLGLVLISDHSQTAAGARVWDRLAHDPDLITQTMRSLYSRDQIKAAKKQNHQVVEPPRSSWDEPATISNIPAKISKHDLVNGDDTQYIAYARSRLKAKPKK